MESRLPVHDVNMNLGDDISRMMAEAGQISQDNRPGLVTSHSNSFRGLRFIRDDYFEGREGLVGYANSDGIGTKVEVAERLSDHTTVAHDLFAMACDDAVIRGAEPYGINTVLDFGKLDDNENTRSVVDQIIEGYVNAAILAGVVILNGEVAILGDRVQGYGPVNYNWCATVQWKAHESRLLTGENIKPGHAIVGLAEPGFRSNGISDVRSSLRETYGEKWHDEIVPQIGNISLGELVQIPSTIYSPLINSLLGGYRIEQTPKAKISGIAHITGGGQPEKVGNMLVPSGKGIIIDNPLTPPATMLHVQSLKGYSDEEAYHNWHMGPGMVVATPEPEEVIAEAENHKVEAQQIGYVTNEPMIRIKNMGTQQDQEWLTFDIKK